MIMWSLQYFAILHKFMWSGTCFIYWRVWSKTVDYYLCCACSCWILSVWGKSQERNIFSVLFSEVVQQRNTETDGEEEWTEEVLFRITNQRNQLNIIMDFPKEWWLYRIKDEAYCSEMFERSFIGFPRSLWVWISLTCIAPS